MAPHMILSPELFSVRQSQLAVLKGSIAISSRRRDGAQSRRFPPFRSKQPLPRHGDQDIRVVVTHAVYPPADGAPFVGANTGFTHQLEKPW